MGLIFMVRHPNAVFRRRAAVLRRDRLDHVRDTRCAICGRVAHVVRDRGDDADRARCRSSPSIRWASGHWFVSSYPGGYFTFASPHLFGTLFSVERGCSSGRRSCSSPCSAWRWRAAGREGWLPSRSPCFVVHTYLLASWYSGISAPATAIAATSTCCRSWEFSSPFSSPGSPRQPRLGRPLAVPRGAARVLSAVQMLQVLAWA